MSLMSLKSNGAQKTNLTFLTPSTSNGVSSLCGRQEKKELQTVTHDEMY